MRFRNRIIDMEVSPTKLNNFARVRICRPTQKPIMLNRKFPGNVNQIFSRRLFFHSRRPFCAGRTGSTKLLTRKEYPLVPQISPPIIFPRGVARVSLFIHAALYTRRRPFSQFPPIWRSDIFAFCTNYRVVGYIPGVR